MKKIVLISCVSEKLDVPARAEELYTSALFKYNLCYAKSLAPDEIYILSAKYGVVPPDKIIEPYNLTLNEMSSAQVRVWAERVAHQLGERVSLDQDHFVFLAGNSYRKFLLSKLRSYEIPLEGMRIGEQLHFLKEHCNE